jgi:hypothetical protein
MYWVRVLEESGVCRRLVPSSRRWSSSVPLGTDWRRWFACCSNFGEDGRSCRDRQVREHLSAHAGNRTTYTYSR